MYTITEAITREFSIKKSKFICSLVPVSSIEEANMHLSSIKTLHLNANHNCYSYIIGQTGEIAKSSDDGEPAKTAGPVIYQALQTKEMTNILCVVTRYFGGIKLGAGGLIRAYSGCTHQTLLEATKIELKMMVRLTITFHYAFLDPIKHLLRDCLLIDETFSDTVSLTYQITKENIKDVIEDLVNLTNNQITYHFKEEGHHAAK